MEVRIRQTTQFNELTHEQVMHEDAPFDVCFAFIDTETEFIYIASDGEGYGPFWLLITGAGEISAFAPHNLPLEGTIREIDPIISIEY